MGKDVIKDFDEKQNGIAAKIIPVVRQCVSNRAVHQRVAIQALQVPGCFVFVFVLKGVLHGCEL